MKLRNYELTITYYYYSKLWNVNMPLVGNICEMPHTLLRMYRRSVVHVYEATLENLDFQRTNIFQIDMASLILASFHSSSYINIFGNLWHGCIWNWGLCGAALLSMGWGSPGTAGPTEYSKKDWVCFTRHSIIWNDLHALLSFHHGIFVTKDRGKDSHLSCCNMKRLQQTILLLLLLST